MLHIKDGLSAEEISKKDGPKDNYNTPILN